MSLDDVRASRLKKLALLKEAGVDPYPASAHRTHTIANALSDFSSLEGEKTSVTLCGRVRNIRTHGASTFIDLEDGTAKIQGYLKKDLVGDEEYTRFLDTVDIGDFVELTGHLFITKKEERTLEAATWKMLSKTLLPLPEKWHGLQDVEERFRRRYVDLIMNEDVRARFTMRSRITRAIRDFFDMEGFLEVETPMLQPIAGGALARPFVTHHNALDIDLYLRIAPELYLKRLLVGGFEKVYELNRSFRNEGIDHTHNPEFTTIEWYAAYWDEETMMKCVEECFYAVLKALNMGDTLIFDEKKVVFKGAFNRITFKDILRQYADGIDYDAETRDSLAKKAKAMGISVASHESKGKIADEIFKKVARPHLINPTFITNHPLDISPLAKRSSNNPEEVRRFQLVIAGFELVNAFSELNDPLDQRARFEEQEQRKEEGEGETHEMDIDFVEALEYGMPPAAGAAISIDRITMLLSNTQNIREVIFFPTLRPKK